MSDYNSSKSTDGCATGLAAVAVMLVAVPVILVFSLLMAFPVEWLWNYLFADPITSILGFGLHQLDFWHALALLVLCSLLFKSSGSSGNNSKS